MSGPQGTPSTDYIDAVEEKKKASHSTPDALPNTEGRRREAKRLDKHRCKHTCKQHGRNELVIINVEYFIVTSMNFVPNAVSLFMQNSLH